MALLKASFVALAMMAVVVAEPPPPGPQNSYLPPTNNNNNGNSGYNYNRPSPSFSAPRPTPAYNPPQNSYTPSPSFSAPKPAPSYGPPSAGGNAPYPASVRPPQGGGGGHDHDHHEPGMPYDFNYAVKDDYYGTDFSHNAASDGDVVRGEYRVLLPDGRTQIVRYTADWKNGYNAEVTYEGTASYPAPSNNNNVNQQYGPPKTGY